ncbi:MAG: deoxyribonuclease IV [Bacillota bacterium]
MIIGKHVSIAGGLDKSIKRALDIGCNSMQIFVKSPRSWKARELSEDEITKFKDNREKYSISPVVVHATYLINTASPKKDLWEKSVDGLITDYKRSAKIGADYLVFHPGSHTGDGLKNGIDRIIKALNIVLNEVNNETLLLLENVAGAGSSIGSSFEVLQQIIENVDKNEKLGVCIDTCHAFAAEYNLAQEDGLEKMISDIENSFGLDRLKVIHVNDSKYKFGEKKDEHAHIGEGEIGKKGFANIINHSKLKDIPFILETPWFNDGPDEDVILLKELKISQEE